MDEGGGGDQLALALEASGVSPGSIRDEVVAFGHAGKIGAAGRPIMIPGRNVDIEHGGRSFQIQVEDLGAEAKAFEVRLAEGGSILWQKKVSYEEQLQGVDEDDHDRELATLVEKTVHTVEAALRRGKLP